MDSVLPPAPVSFHSVTLGSFTTLAPVLASQLHGVQLQPPARELILMGSMDSVLPPAQRSLQAQRRPQPLWHLRPPPLPPPLPHRASLAQPSRRTATSVSATLSVSPSVQQTLAGRALQFLVPPPVPPASSLSLMEESPTRVAQSGFTEGSTRANIGALLSMSTFHFTSSKLFLCPFFQGGPHRHPCERRG